MKFNELSKCGDLDIIKLRYLNEYEQKLFNATNSMVFVRVEISIYEQITWYIVENEYSFLDDLIYKYHRIFGISNINKNSYIINLENIYKRNLKLKNIL